MIPWKMFWLQEIYVNKEIRIRALSKLRGKFPIIITSSIQMHDCES